MKLPKVCENKTYELCHLIKWLMAVHKNIYLDVNNIKVEYFDSWKFYKVSIFRWSKCGAGCGDKQYRNNLWEKHKLAFSELFDMYSDPSVTWKTLHECYYLEPNQKFEVTNGIIPGITFFVKIENID